MQQRPISEAQAVHPVSERPELAETGEATAQGWVAEIYGDIRATLDVPLVNLVYRYLATRPGALPWAWGWLRPHFVSGALAGQADALRATVAHETAPWALDLQPITEAAQVAGLVAAYNRANALNLMALTHLLHLAASAGEAMQPQHVHPRTSSPPPASAVPPRPPLPPLPAWSDVPGAQQALVLRLNRFADECVPQVVASLYRHLTLWPAVPARLEAELLRLDAGGQLIAARAHTARAAARIAAAQPLGPLPEPAAGLDSQTLCCLRSFATVTLPKMLPIGLALQAACRQAAHPTPSPRA